MSIADQPLDSITQADLQQLVDDEAAESLRIEYKAKLSIDSPNEKKEFLRDVSSLANTAGGDMYCGIPASDGKPQPFEGLEISTIDDFALKVDSVIRDGLEPKLSGHRVRCIPLDSGKYIIAIRVPRSYAAPHRVSYMSTPQFWARRSNGKYFLEANELRNAFLLSETATDKIRNFRVDRVSKLLAGQGPVIVEKGPKLVFHLIPLDAFQTARFLDLNSIKNQERNLGAIGWADVRTGPNHVRFNLDGFLVSHARDGNPKLGLAACQWFRNGIVESFSSLWVEKQKLNWNVFEDSLPKSVKRFLEVQNKLGVKPPIVALLTVCDVRDFTMVIERSYGAMLGDHDPIDRDHLFVPEIMIESFDCDLQSELRPLIDAVWNAAGYPESPVKKSPP